ncbi:MAG: hypothetical protein CBE00_02875 [Planctomycetaceae bacterium TMED240]|nr:hypothetical protein [Rhodopirellula sp.]OUX08012.1 MAG: hypothetical protein CBE00_02875 [Planctomycetaceae bacterium TMED240]
MAGARMDVAATGTMSQPAGRLIKFVSECCWLTLGCLVLCTFLAFFSSRFWVAELLANLRVQLVIAGLLVLFIGVFLRHWRLALLACVVIALHLSWFATAFPPVSNGDSFRHFVTVTSVNVLSENVQHDRVIADLIEANADVIAVLELTPMLDQKLRQDLPAYSHVMSRSENSGNFGVGVYSKYPLADAEYFESVEAIDSIAVTVMVEQVRGKEEKFRLFVTHPLPPMNGGLFEKRNRQLEDVADRIHRFRKQASAIPVVLLGDLNLTPWSPWFLELQSRSGLVRGISHFSLEPTWYCFPLFPFGLVIDHGLIEPSLACSDFKVGKPMGADHRSITLRIASSD